eukprot:TRINITY_DN5303_c0_g1_i2.p1 TRINITY_DN5303_c0_g1~~TRINITY_DN5303_c0_g1_i2.p1  ORF type:complete len:346 (+),score=51.96 TRINITY_DN5303_c0_g1_i2:234-1271(+)
MSALLHVLLAHAVAQTFPVSVTTGIFDSALPSLNQFYVGNLAYMETNLIGRTGYTVSLDHIVLTRLSTEGCPTAQFNATLTYTNTNNPVLWENTIDTDAGETQTFDVNVIANKFNYMMFAVTFDTHAVCAFEYRVEAYWRVRVTQGYPAIEYLLSNEGIASHIAFTREHGRGAGKHTDTAAMSGSYSGAGFEGTIVCLTDADVTFRFMNATSLVSVVGSNMVKYDARMMFAVITLPKVGLSFPHEVVITAQCIKGRKVYISTPMSDVSFTWSSAERDSKSRDSSSTAETDSPVDDGVNTLVIILIAVGGAVLFAVVVAGVYLACHKPSRPGQGESKIGEAQVELM